MNDAKPTCGWNESAPSFPGKDCQCEAHSESECGFDADWTPSEVYKLRKERDEAREELAEAKRESENLARSIYRTEYSDNDTGWELLESVAGVISQIDNMYAGVREQRDEAREDAAHWKTEYEIVVARLCGKKHPRDNGIISEHEIVPKLTQERDEAREDATNYYARIGELESERDEAIFVMRETRRRLDDAWLEIERLKSK